MHYRQQALEFVTWMIVLLVVMTVVHIPHRRQRIILSASIRFHEPGRNAKITQTILQ
jgi:hypothetical protein